MERGREREWRGDRGKPREGGSNSGMRLEKVVGGKERARKNQKRKGKKIWLKLK